MKIIIIGGSVAGHSAAVKLRQNYPDAEITLISEEPYPFYDRRKLLDYWQEKVKEKDVLLSSFDFYQKQKINFIKEAKVVAVNPIRRSVSYKLAEKRASEEYDFLVIASGCKTSLHDSEGINKTGVIRFDSFTDFKGLKSMGPALDSVCLIGSNHLASRIIESIVSRKIEVKLITDKPQENLSEMVEIINSQVVEIIGDSGVQAIKLKEGKIIGVSWVGVVSETLPSLDFLEGVDIQKNGLALAVDENMRTSISDIFACGSVCLRHGEISGIKSWDESLKEGLSVADNLLKS